MDEYADIEMAGEGEDEASAKVIASQWLRKFNEEAFGPTHLEEHWRTWVPKIYSPSMAESCLNWSFNEELAQKVLFDCLEQFICNGDPGEVFAKLSEIEKPSSVCGRVFKMGEPTYSCRECGMDKTCVLCVDCFKHSEHRLHKYKMGTSGGGGCCDCGDVEAWKKNPFCSIHQIVPVSEEESKNELPEDLKLRSRIVFEAALKYAYRLLSTEQISDVRLGETSDNFFDIDTYCTILYNDEVHTFEQVISTLSRVLKCSQRHSIEYVTNIDREGRAVVKCSTFQTCSDLKAEIEKFTSRHGNKPLKVLVNHAHVIAHQIYAMKLLSWLQGFLGHGEGFRSVFASVVLAQNGLEPSIIKGILQRDSTLWKSARLKWQHLIISGMLLENENKKALAKIFTKNYGQVMMDFIRDDHDHTFSVSSLSVQLFTVPTLAHNLIANDDVLYILLNTLYSECKRKCNKNGKLEFERSPSSQTFKRALYMLYDLRYLLSSVPEKEAWNDNLRRSFLHGLAVMLNILTMMQGMDAVTRQVGQHMEYEPEWESGFNLHIKLAYSISLAVEWCGTDKVVLVKAYRAVLKHLQDLDTGDAGEVCELADHSTACLHYDVSSEPVSIHLPLTRFLAALHLHLEKYDLHFDSPQFTLKPTPVQIIEPVLRAHVMIGQVHAGMWRRNGYALLNTLYFYHNVKCRTEMLDRDITLLQIGASLIESNEFLIHVLNKFNLINWAMADFEQNSLKNHEEDSMRQTISLVEEMLYLLVVIIGERCMPGISNVTVEDRIKKEIIQYLCIKPLLHSELIKTVPEDLSSHETALDDVIQELAEFKKPTTATSKGVYELKPQYYDQYNTFFYHYTREELSRSEEAQRRRRKAAGEIECCPPPKLLKLNESFNMIVNLLQCDVMLHIMQTVLDRCLNLRARCFSESQLHKVLHLIGYALHEEESKNYPFFKFIENSSKFQIFSRLEKLLSCPRVDAHKGLLKWTVNKFKQVSNQKDHEIQEVAKDSTSEIDSEKERRAKLAAERRAKVMAQMAAMQKNFMKENAQLFEETNIESSASRSNVYGGSSMDISENVEQQPIALGPRQSTRQGSVNSYVCILCQEEEEVSAEGPTMVLAAFVQQATVLVQHRKNHILTDVSKHDPLYLHANLGPAPHTSTCGHVMHGECWRKYFDNIMIREHRRPYRLRHPASFDVDKQEFLCPLCECLSNTVLPIVPSIPILQPSPARVSISFDTYLNSVKILLENKVKMCHGTFKCGLDCENEHCNACKNASNGSCIERDNGECEANALLQAHQIFYSCPIELFSARMGSLPREFVRLFPTSYTELNNNLQEMVQLFAQITYTRGLNLHPHPSDKRLAPMAWKSLAYTIHSIEVILRDQNKPLLGLLSSRHRVCIESLVKIVGVLQSTWSKSFVITSHALNLMSIVFEHLDKGPSVLQWDSLGMLVSMTFALPSLPCKDSPTPIPTGTSLDLFNLRVIFTCHIVKILILLDVKEFQNSMEEDSSEGSELLTVLELMRKNTEGLSGSALWNHIQEICIPFLRSCVLFYHYLTDVPAPAVLQELGGDTFANMCAYLDLPQSPREIFNSQAVFDLVKKWCGHEEVLLYLNGTPLEVIHEPLKVSRLIDLPNDYSELINTISSFTCPNSGEDSRNPTMCLICGEILCSQSYCCQMEVDKVIVGACNHHAHRCGGGVGVFLRVRECEILLLASPNKGCFMSPPYLDDYGETDQGLRRGNPLRLCPERYKKLQTLWLSHSIHEEIARAIESSTHIMSTQWSLL